MSTPILIVISADVVNAHWNVQSLYGINLCSLIDQYVTTTETEHGLNRHVTSKRLLYEGSRLVLRGMCSPFPEVSPVAWPCLPLMVVVNACSFLQVGGCMEGFMIKTGFYDKCVKPSASS